MKPFESSLSIAVVLFVLAFAQSLMASGAPESSSAQTVNPAHDADEPMWPSPQAGCNGHPELCDRNFDEVVFPATHNAMSNAEEDWLFPNQNVGIRAQLVDGIRTFLFDIHEQAGEIQLCHASCWLGSRLLIDAMNKIDSFLRANPQEVITLLFEDHVPSEQIVEVLEETGLTELLYIHDDEEPWPTLREMIDHDTRLVVAAETAGPPPQWFHHLWSIGWDTSYEFASVDEFHCEANRGSKDGALFLVNHWILDPLPSSNTAEVSNSYEVLMKRIHECKSRWDRLPTFIAVDHYDVGDLLEVVEVLNGLKPPRRSAASGRTDPE